MMPFCLGSELPEHGREGGYSPGGARRSNVVWWEYPARSGYTRYAPKDHCPPLPRERGPG